MCSKQTYAFFRILIGILFASRGIIKLFGLASLKIAPTEPFTMYWYIGLFETVAGIAIAIGLFSAVFAVVAALEMLVAYFWMHAPQAWLPFANTGEPALLYFAAFLIIATKGSKYFALDHWLFPHMCKEEMHGHDKMHTMKQEGCCGMHEGNCACKHEGM